MTSDPPDPTTITRDQLRDRQSRKLRRMLEEIIPSNPFWTSKFRDADVDTARVQGVDELALLPLTTKAEILADHDANPPYGSNLTYDLHTYSRLHQTSGTTGVPMRALDTPQSWQWVLSCWAQIYRIVGLTPRDRLVFPFSFGPFLGFWAGFEGAAQLGNLCLAGGGMSSEARLELILEHEATFVCCTPTYALRLAEVAREQGLDLAQSAVRAILVAGEPGGNIPSTRRQIETAWGARVLDHWGMTEVGALAVESFDDPGGLYVLETECIPEIIDPVTGDAVPPGNEGELVITNLGRWGSPLIRYRTGDRVRAREPSEHDQLPLMYLSGGILGRTDEMIIIRGNNVYPSRLEDILRGFEEVVEFRINIETRKEMPHVRIEVEPQPHVHDTADGEQLAARITQVIKDRQNFHAEITLVPSGSLPRFEMKGRRFFRRD